MKHSSTLLLGQGDLDLKSGNPAGEKIILGETYS